MPKPTPERDPADGDANELGIDPEALLSIGDCTVLLVSLEINPNLTIEQQGQVGQSLIRWALRAKTDAALVDGIIAGKFLVRWQDGTWLFGKRPEGMPLDADLVNSLLIEVEPDTE